MRIKSFSISAFAALAVGLGGLAIAGCHQPAAAELEQSRAGADCDCRRDGASAESRSHGRGAGRALSARACGDVVRGRGQSSRGRRGLWRQGHGRPGDAENRPARIRVARPSAQAALDQARAELANSTAKYNRAKALKQAAAISTEQFDQLASRCASNRLTRNRRTKRSRWRAKSSATLKSRRRSAAPCKSVWSRSASTYRPAKKFTN